MAEKKEKPKTATGRVYLVGAGPGDPGLLTVRGRECLEVADVVVYDYLSNNQLLTYARPDAERIYAGKKSKDHTLTQDQINQLLIDKAREGKIVTRLKGGDPMIFGRGGEEAERLEAAGVPYEMVPGISSAIAGPAYAGIPVTHREFNSQLTIFTGHEDPTKGESSIDYQKLAQTDGVKVMLMGVERLRVIRDQLLKHGATADLPVALVRWATTGNQETLVGTLDDIAEKVAETGFKAPAVAVFGGVVKLRDRLNWFERRPLFGKRIVVTRTRQQAGVLSRQLRDLGADVYELPTIRIAPPENEMAFAQLVQDAHRYDWLIFTSPNGVDRFFEVFFKLYSDLREIGGVKVAAIGPGTAQKVKEYHLGVDLMPKVSVAESLAEAIKDEVGSVDNLTMLWVRAESARRVLADTLNSAGAILDEAVAYRTIPETEDLTGAVERFRTEGADVITFTSSSTVECFLDLGLPLPEGLKIASIGPITSATLKERGLPIHIEAREHNIPGLVEAIREHFEAAPKSR